MNRENHECLCLSLLVKAFPQQSSRLTAEAAPGKQFHGRASVVCLIMSNATQTAKDI
jgi:hypothetical protein